MGRAIQYFHEMTGPLLYQYHVDLAATSSGRETPSIRIGHGPCRQHIDRWTRYFLQGSQAHPAIRHILVATASLHESRELGQGIPDPIFYRHYGKAIECMRKNDEILSLEETLMSCLLFACCDFLGTNRRAGMSHVRAGSKIINEIPPARRSQHDLVGEYFQPVFECFMSRAFTFECNRILPTDSQTEVIGLPPSTVECFRDVTEASESFFGAMRRLVVIAVGTSAAVDFPIVERMKERARRIERCTSNSRMGFGNEHDPRRQGFQVSPGVQPPCHNRCIHIPPRNRDCVR